MPLPHLRLCHGTSLLGLLLLALTRPASLATSVAATPTFTPMPVISRGVPAFASGSAPNIPPSAANDGNETSMWVSNTIPAWLAYDLSSVPVNQRQQALIAWYAPWSLGYFNSDPTPDLQLPVDYTIDINPAPGGPSPPATGWQTIISVTGNSRGVRQHLVNLTGANWVRLRATAGSNPSSIAIDFDVHSAPDGASDSWLFMGDSITGVAAYLFSDIPARVNTIAPDRWPAIIPGARGGSNTGTANDLIDEYLADFPGRFVVLAYGTNDGDDNAFSSNLEILILKVFAAGKIPVIPHMPWSDIPDQLAKAPLINARIDTLYAKYPAILRGPDLYTAFLNRPDWIPPGDVHPSGPGNAELRRQWALAMTAANNRTVTFAAWAQAWSLTTNADGPADDPDRDGTSNLLEYALGLDPSEPSTASLPALQPEGGSQVYRFTHPKSASPLTWRPRTSTDLTAWSDGPAPSLESSTATTETFVISLPPGEPRRFLKLEVAIP